MTRFEYYPIGWQPMPCRNEMQVIYNEVVNYCTRLRSLFDTEMSGFDTIRQSRNLQIIFFGLVQFSQFRLI
jgi:hypothetical protein